MGGAARQSVMAQTQGGSPSAVGFALRKVVINEVHPESNICLASDTETNETFQVGLNKRGSSAVWPQPGDGWIIDRSMGHWALKCKITDTQAPTFTGNSTIMNTDLLQMLGILRNMGLVQDGTTEGPAPVLPTVTGSRATIRPEVQTIITILANAGILQDLTTPATVVPDVWQEVTLTSGWTAHTTADRPRYKLNYDNTVSIEGRVVAPAGVTSGTSIFTLASGYRPPWSKCDTTMVAVGIPANLTVGTDGTVRIFDFGSITVIMTLFNMRYSLQP
jgi:uncharacterized membrane protein